MVEDEVFLKTETLCKQNGITKYRLSKLTGISQASLSKMTKKQSTVSLVTLEKICAALDITLAQFFSDSNEYPDLSAEQRRLLACWNSLDKAKRDFSLKMMEELHKF